MKQRNYYNFFFSLPQILLELPARVHGLNWQLVFSTEANGFSLNQLYRRSMEADQDTPALLIVKDVEQNVKKFFFSPIQNLYLNIIDIRCIFFSTING